MREQDIPGLSLAIAKDGKLLYKQGYGLARSCEKVVPSSLFRIASISKTLTAVAILRLVEKGKLNMNCKIFGPKGILSMYSPTAKSDRRILKITLCHLLQHSGGWDFDVIGDPMYYRHVGAIMGEPEPVTPETLIQFMMTQKLQFTPGTKHSYCNFGYLVLGQVVKVTSCDKYEHYIRQMLLKTDIKSVRVGKTRKEEAYENEVHYFSFPPNDLVDSVFPGEGWVASPYGAFVLENDAPVGGLISTADDMVKFFSSIDGTGPVQLIKRESFKLMLERPKYAKGRENWYGLGLEMGDMGKTWEHTGGMDGTTSTLTRDRSGFTWACLCNTWVNDTDLSSVVRFALSKVENWSLWESVIISDFKFADVIISGNKLNMVKILIKEDELLTVLQSVKELGCCQVTDNGKTKKDGYQASASNHGYQASNHGYQVTWIDGYTSEGILYFNVIWTKQTRETQVSYNLSEFEMTKHLEGISNSGTIPIHLDSYIKNGDIFFALIVSEIYSQDGVTQDWKVHVNQSSSDQEKFLEEYRGLGYYPRVCSVCNMNNELRVSTLYWRTIDKTLNFWSKHDLNKEQYEREFSRHARYGHLLTYAKAYRHGDGNKFSAIWTNPGPYIYSSSHHLSKYGLYVDLMTYASRDFQVSCISGYVSEDDFLSFIVAWKKPCKVGAVSSKRPRLD